MFKLRITGDHHGVFVHVCKSKRKDKDWMICNDETIGRAKKKAGSRFEYKQKLFDFPEYWLNNSGTYYWQAYRTHAPTITDCKAEGQIVHFKVADVTALPVRIGCSGWNYADWRGRVYPAGLPPRRWLAHYATLFDTVEVNSTFYRLARPRRSPAGSRRRRRTSFHVKASRYLTHMKRLTDMERGVERLYAGIAPLVDSPKLGPVLWQLPERFHRDDDRLAFALERLPPGRHCFEFRHPSWFCSEVYGLLHTFGVALVIGDDARRPLPPAPLTTDWTLIRFHYGARGRRGNYSEARVARVGRPDRASCARHAEVLAYFNNDWEGFAVRNGLRLARLLEVEASLARC